MIGGAFCMHKKGGREDDAILYLNAPKNPFLQVRDAGRQRRGLKKKMQIGETLFLGKNVQPMPPLQESCA